MRGEHHDRQGLQVYYIHDDALGGTNVISNASGTVAEVLDYYPFGGIRVNQQATPTLGEQRRFTGQEFDAGTGSESVTTDFRLEARVGRPSARHRHGASVAGEEPVLPIVNLLGRGKFRP